MPARYINISIAAVVTILVLALSLTNLALVSFSLFGTVTQLPLAAPMLATFVLGGLAAAALTRTRVKEIQSEKKLLKWDSEDAKLAAEVKDDYVKQLEAKNATLDAALKAALKKQKS